MNNEITNLDDELDQDLLDIIDRYRKEREEALSDCYHLCSEDLLRYSIEGLSALDV